MALIGVDGDVVDLERDLGADGQQLVLIAGVKGDFFRLRSAPELPPQVLLFKDPVEYLLSAERKCDPRMACAVWERGGRALSLHVTMRAVKVPETPLLPRVERPVLRRAARRDALAGRLRLQRRAQAALAQAGVDGAPGYTLADGVVLVEQLPALAGDGGDDAVVDHQQQQLDLNAGAQPGAQHDAQPDPDVLRATALLEERAAAQREAEDAQDEACKLAAIEWTPEALLEEAFAQLMRSESVLTKIDEETELLADAAFELDPEADAKKEARRRYQIVRRRRQRLYKKLRLKLDAERARAGAAIGRWLLSPTLIPPSHKPGGSALTAAQLGVANRHWASMIELPAPVREAWLAGLRAAGLDLSAPGAGDETWQLGQLASIDPGMRCICTVFCFNSGTVYCFGDGALNEIRRTCLDSASRDQGVVAASRAAREKAAAAAEDEEDDDDDDVLPLEPGMLQTGIVGHLAQPAPAAQPVDVTAILDEKVELQMLGLAGRLRAEARRRRDNLYNDIANFCAFAFDTVVMGSLDSGQLMRDPKKSRKMHSDAALLAMAKLREALERASKSWSPSRRFRFFPKEREACSTRSCPMCGVGNHAVGRAKVLECPDPLCEAHVPRDVGAARTIAAKFLYRLYKQDEARQLQLPVEEQRRRSKQELKDYKASTILPSARRRLLGHPAAPPADQDSLSTPPPTDNGGGDSEVVR